jgi:chromosomal replication initiation ATPase DnaA
MAPASELSATLPLVPERRRLLPKLVRRLDAIDFALLGVLNDLAHGKARWPLFLFGPAGGGKTCAALALADIVETASFATCEDLAEATMKGQDAAIWYAVKAKHLAILDELGARERVTDLGYSVVKRFADLREQHAKRVAIYISNVAPEAIAKLYDDRIASRVLSGTCFHLQGADRRLA